MDRGTDYRSYSGRDKNPCDFETGQERRPSARYLIKLRAQVFVALFASRNFFIETSNNCIQLLIVSFDRLLEIFFPLPVVYQACSKFL